jgi:hypothetical protein
MPALSVNKADAPFAPGPHSPYDVIVDARGYTITKKSKDGGNDIPVAYIPSEFSTFFLCAVNVAHNTMVDAQLEKSE